jgi:hypothetical protein
VHGPSMIAAKAHLEPGQNMPLYAKTPTGAAKIHLGNQ